MVKRQEQAIPGLEPIERSAEDPPVDLSIQLVDRGGDVGDELDRFPAAFDRTECRADDLAPEPRPEGVVVSQRGEPLPGGEQGVLCRIRGIGL